MTDSIAKDDLFFHSVHGLCRVSGLNAATKSEPAQERSFTLLPVSNNRAKVRFTIPESSWEQAGFNKLISIKEAQLILDYFKTGNRKDSQSGQAWLLAETIWMESQNKEPIKDARRRQKLERAVKGLAGELAFVLKSTSAEVALRIQKNLGAPAALNPFVLLMLTNVEEHTD